MNVFFIKGELKSSFILNGINHLLIKVKTNNGFESFTCVSDEFEGENMINFPPNSKVEIKGVLEKDEEKKILFKIKKIRRIS